LAAHRSPTIGFVGLGKMGVPMVQRLLAAGFEVIGANRSPEVVSRLAAEGMRPAAAVEEVAEVADIIMTALPNIASVVEVTDRLLASGRTGQVIIEHSTITPGLAQSINLRARDLGIGYLDAPVSGGPAGAQAGKLTVMAGGPADLLERVRPVLSAYGDPIRLCGEVGAGQAIKLVNQLLVAIHTTASAEAVAFGVSLGADLDSIREVIGTSFGSSAMLNRNLPRFSAADYTPATPVALIRKDLSLIRGEAEAAGSPLLLGVVAERVFDSATEHGYGAEDMAALFKLWPDAIDPL
jgi:3-hydroxyisobutyrate dehydrogenase-like beta-hydroxyacid dehydrogenase